MESLTAFYSRPKHHGAISGYNTLKYHTEDLDQKQLRSALYGESSYTKFLPRRKNFPRRRILAYGPNELYQSDIIDWKRFATQNDGFGFVFILVDVFTKYTWLVPQRRKTGQETSESLNHVMMQIGKGDAKIQTDMGKRI